MRNNKPLYNTYQVYKYLIFFPLLGMSTAFIFVVIFAFFYITSQRFVQIAGILWARFNSFITPMFVSIRGIENIERDRSYVVVANHQSQYDIFVIYGWLPIDFRWVMKIELRRVPILGYYCYRAGHIYIDRSNREASIRSINEAKTRISKGTSVVFFPEGTRSETGELIDFKKGAFRFALDMGLPVLPVTITGTREILPDNSIGLFPGNAKMIIHRPIDIEGYTDKSIDDLIARARKAIEAGLDGRVG
ncbi:MAG: 1-acyl-sn-glycerol-3-phosphate acyltransferase [Chrysiogenales bacterium]|nr:MAG: 1-acyl-sn-glycerol-3-phosphate acyltransferase [Chrysiogenales bacterium]